MKPFEQQTYYELLEVPVTAPVEDIRAAYSRLMELYAPDSIAVYALVEPEQVDALRARMTEAMEILTDAELRAEYDKDLGLPVQRMVEAVAAGGAPSTGAPPEAGAVARAAEALASAAVREDAPAPEDTASSATPPPEPPATTPSGPEDFRATFFRGFSFAYVSSSISLHDAQRVGSAVSLPPLPPVAPTPAEPASGTAAAPPVSAPAEVASMPAAATASAPSEPAQASPGMPPAGAGLSEPSRAPVPASPARDPAPARPGGPMPPGPRAVPPPLPSARAAARAAAADSQAAPPPPEQGRPSARPPSGRQLDEAQVIAQDSAIATAEAALAQVAARVREPPPRPRTPDIPPDAEFNGELLRRVREARGQSLQQVADRTRISKAHLENVEADRYAALPAQVYLRGILMNLARELGLDPLRVSRSYLALASEKSGKK
jgi:hypothetical protein